MRDGLWSGYGRPRHCGSGLGFGMRRIHVVGQGIHKLILSFMSFRVLVLRALVVMMVYAVFRGEHVEQLHTWRARLHDPVEGHLRQGHAVRDALPG